MQHLKTRSVLFLMLLLAAASCIARTASVPAQAQFNDSHFHLTNYVQEGISVEDYLALMGSRVGRSTLFGIPLQQTWSKANSGDFAPTYYLHSDAPLYYYSFTDASIAQAYLKLSAAQQQRFDPMITGFNPADNYAADHIRRVLQTFPGVFSGIGEFSIHKEFVSSKVAGSKASLFDPALDKILELAGQAGLLVILHNDVDRPFAGNAEMPIYLQQLLNVFKRHPDATIIWAHIGLGRVVQPAEARIGDQSLDHIDMVDYIVAQPELRHVYFDISWSEVARYALQSETAIQRVS